MGEIVAVLSGKGGTGKTSVGGCIATALAQDGKRVLCVDCDVGLRNLDISLGIADLAPPTFLDVCSGSVRLDALQPHPLFPSLRFLTAPTNRSIESIDPDSFYAMVMQARSMFDYVFLDAPAGVDAGFRLAAGRADRILLVTGADPASIRDAGHTGRMLELMGKTQVRLIVNRVNPRLFSTMALTVDDVMDDAGLPLMGVVPDDANVVLAAAFATPLLCYAKRGAAAACRRIAKRIQGMPQPIPKKLI